MPLNSQNGIMSFPLMAQTSHVLGNLKWLVFLIINSYLKVRKDVKVRTTVLNKYNRYSLITTGD